MHWRFVRVILGIISDVEREEYKSGGQPTCSRAERLTCALWVIQVAVHLKVLLFVSNRFALRQTGNPVGKAELLYFRAEGLIQDPHTPMRASG
jgi:hypothetical protein